MRDDWVETTLGEVARTRPPAGVAAPGIPYVALEHFDSGSPDLRRWGDTADATSATTPFKPGDVLFGKLRPYLRKVVVTEFSGRCTNEALAYRASSPALSQEYLALLLRSDAALSHASVTTGTRMPRTSARSMASMRVLLPSIEEQRRIVDLMSHVDGLVASAVRALDALRRAREAALASQVSIVSDGGLPLASMVRITDCEHKTAPTAGEHEVVAGHVVGTPAIRDGRLIHAEARPVNASTFAKWTSRRLPQEGDVVLTREAPVGQAALIREEDGPLCLGQRTVLLSPDERCDPAFVLAVLMSPAYQEWMRVASVSQTVNRINVKRLGQMPVPAVPIDEQRAIGLQLRRMLEAEDRGREEIGQLRTLRSALLATLLTAAHEIPSSYDEFIRDEGAA